MVTNVDYSYYRDVFFGDSIPESSFNGMAFKAGTVVGQYIGSNNTEDHSEEIKAAICAVAEVLYQEHVRNGKASENTDGYSVSFDTSKSIENKAYLAARPYLLHTGLLYRGVSGC